MTEPFTPTATQQREATEAAAAKLAEKSLHRIAEKLLCAPAAGCSRISVNVLPTARPLVTRALESAGYRVSENGKHLEISW